MKAKRHQIFIGAGLVAALSCGLAPIPASAFGAELPADALPIIASDSNAVSDVTASQPVTSKVAPGQQGSMRVRLTNNTAAPTAKGATFEFKAPAGTLFRADSVQFEWSTGYKSSFRPEVSKDWKTLTVTFGDPATGHSLGAGEYVDVVANFGSQTDNTRSGRVADGSFTVTGGAAFPVGTTTPLAYEAEYVAPVAVVLNAPAIGAVVTDTNRPVFSGAGEVGAEITVRGSSGRVVAATTVGSDGTWSVPADFDLVNGNYFGTVTQGIDGSSARYEFSLKYQAPKVEIVPVALTSPAKNEQVLAGTPMFEGEGQPGATVTLMGRYGTPLGSGVVKADGTWQIESIVSLNVGSYAVIATQKVDSNVSTAEVEFTTVEPGFVTLTGPALDAVLEAGKPVFTGTGKAGATVIVQGRFGTVLGQTTVAANGEWSVESTVSLVPASYAGLAKQEANGKTTTAPFQFTVK